MEEQRHQAKEGLNTTSMFQILKEHMITHLKAVDALCECATTEELRAAVQEVTQQALVVVLPMSDSASPIHHEDTTSKEKKACM